jgi:hypothetical protein
MPPTPAVALLSHPWANFGINLGLLVVGLLIGACVVFFCRKLIRRYSWQGYPHLLVSIDAGLVIAGTIMTSGLDLWRKQVWMDLDIYSGAGYVFMGVLIAVGVGSKWLLSVAREISTSRVAELTREAAQTARERDYALNAEALIREVMKAKLNRLITRRRTGHGTLEEALAPGKQIHVLIHVLHGHFSKRLSIGHRLRIGIYMLAEDGKTLEAVYSWDGAKTDCFSNRHADFMKITNPGGSRSVVVECWQSAEPFVCITDGEEAQRQGRFRYFYSGQEKDLRSMIAYRHNLSESTEAFVMTLDSNQPGFFSADAESECRLLLPAFSRRIELELFALPATPTSVNPPLS